MSLSDFLLKEIRKAGTGCALIVIDASAVIEWLFNTDRGRSIGKIVVDDAQDWHRIGKRKDA